MPRTSVTITNVNRTGVAQPAQQTILTTNNAVLPNNDGRVLLELDASTGTVNYDILIPRLVDGEVVDPKDVAVTSGTPKLVGPLPPSVYNNVDGTVYIDVDSDNARIRAYQI